MTLAYDDSWTIQRSVWKTDQQKQQDMQSTLLSWNTGNIARVDLIRCLRFKLAVWHIIEHRLAMIGVGCCLEFPVHVIMDIFLLHQAVDANSAGCFTLIFQVTVQVAGDPSCAINPTRLLCSHL